jgi:CRP-like cAMP-binding protein
MQRFRFLLGSVILVLAATFALAQTGSIQGTVTDSVGAVVQGAGLALRMDAATFRRELARSQAFQRGIEHYVYVQLGQLAQTAACTRFHVVEARLARWLLMTQDRAQSSSFHVTQEFLAFMLGVARQSVGIAVGDLQDRGLIEYHHGEMHILDRPGLEAASCECYEIVRAEFSRLLGIARA